MPSSTPAVAHYAGMLAAEVLPSEALCLTAVRGLTTAEALARFGADGPTRLTTIVDAGTATTNAFPDELPLVLAGEHSGWVVLVEDNGFHGSLPETLARLSVGGVAVCAYWNVDFDSAISLARDGEVVGTFEFALGGLPQAGPLTPFLVGLDFEDADTLCASALAFVDQVTGVRLGATWALAAHPAAVIADPDSLSGTTGWLAVNAPEVFEALPAADPDLLRDLADAAAARACAANGITYPPEHPDDLAALSHAAHQRALELRWDRCAPTDEVDPAAVLRADFARRTADTTAERALTARAHAYAAALTARSADPVDAVAETIAHACQAVRPRWDALRAAVGARL
ncbi:DUF6461 domain-containing protein, partial [Umezawaea endophytica]|uniref:DUF6461 domain-containing protein n=1 Tax=Umezawaea endophytica TaxID=1654476 RepID=UPI0035E78FAF